MNIPLKSITETSLSEIYSLAFFSSNFNERQKYVVTIIIAVFKIIPNITIKNVLRIYFLLFSILNPFFFYFIINIVLIIIAYSKI